MKNIYIFAWVVALVMIAAFGTAIAAPSVLKDPRGLPERVTKQSFVRPIAGYGDYDRCYRKCWTDDYGVRHCRRRCY